MAEEQLCLVSSRLVRVAVTGQQLQSKSSCDWSVAG